MPIELVVPRSWRRRVAVLWSPAQPSPAVRILGCSSPPKWFGYAGGFVLHVPACVPLIVRVGGRSTTIRFAIGRRC